MDGNEESFSAESAIISDDRARRRHVSSLANCKRLVDHCPAFTDCSLNEFDRLWPSTVLSFNAQFRLDTVICTFIRVGRVFYIAIIVKDDIVVENCSQELKWKIISFRPDYTHAKIAGRK